jgi:hypothetical protein
MVRPVAKERVQRETRRASRWRSPERELNSIDSPALSPRTRRTARCGSISVERYFRLVRREEKKEEVNAHSCSKPFAAAPISSILTLVGLLILSLESAEIDSVTVAEKRSVWRERGAAVIISSSSSRKPCMEEERKDEKSLVSSDRQRGRRRIRKREGKTHLFEHPVCLVENENLNTVHREAGSVANMVDETTGCRNDDVGALLEFGFLDLEGETTCCRRKGKRTEENEKVQEERGTHRHRDRTRHRCTSPTPFQRHEPAPPIHASGT